MTTRGERIRLERVRRGMTRPQLAEASGIAERTIGRIERDERESRYRPLLEEFLGLPAIIGGEQVNQDDIDNPRLSEATDSQLLSEQARRMANRGDGPPARIRPGTMPPDLPNRPGSYTPDPLTQGDQDSKNGH